MSYIADMCITERDEADSAAVPADPLRSKQGKALNAGTQWERVLLVWSGVCFSKFSFAP